MIRKMLAINTYRIQSVYIPNFISSYFIYLKYYKKIYLSMEIKDTDQCYEDYLFYEYNINLKRLSIQIIDFLFDKRKLIIGIVYFYSNNQFQIILFICMGIGIGIGMDIHLLFSIQLKTFLRLNKSDHKFLFF